MKKNRLPFLFAGLLLTVLPIDTDAQRSGSSMNKQAHKALQTLVEQEDRYRSIAKQIWSYAELGYQEEKSSTLLKSTLEKEGFKIESGVAEIPTAFVASYGSGSPVIAILGEYDALPGVSQAAVPQRQEMETGGAGHACGHHLCGTGSAAAAIAVRQWLEQSGQSGTIRFYGTPAEEGGAGKVYMVRAGLFDDVDAVLHWHPGSSNGASAASSLANKSAKFRFRGIASHAAASPQNGRSALDGVEAMNYMVNLMREHVLPDSRIHYVITRGGEAPNVVPEFAEVFYYCRHPEMSVVKENFERIVKAAEGAAMGTGTTVDYEVIHGLYNVLPNETLSEIMYKNLQSVGGVHYDETETAFAEKIMESYTFEKKSPIESANKIQPYQVINKGRGGSTDVGDVSWAVPTAGMRAATWVPGTSAHSWQAVAAGGMSIGHKGMMVAAKTLTLTAIDIYLNPSVTKTARKELIEKRGENFVYKSLLGDRKPPLDYRK
ncbi:MAG: amidohydrolase [Bacteroidota bacterium]